MNFDKVYERPLTAIERQQLQEKLDRAKVLVDFIDNKIDYADDTSEYDAIRTFVKNGEIGDTKESQLSEDEQKTLNAYFEELKGLYKDLK